MDISLIICTRDRCRQLSRCLEAIRLIFIQPIHPASALGGVIKLGEAPHLAASLRRLKARGRARLQGGDMAGAEEPIDPVRAH